MVSPIYLIITPLLVSFLLPLFDRIHRKLSIVIFLSTITYTTLLSGYWLFSIIFARMQPAEIFTAGFSPPYSINLRFGLSESFLLFLSNFVALCGALYLLKNFNRKKIYGMMLYLTMLLGISGLVMTRDLFNTFVFLEITSISIYAIIALDDDSNAVSAGFKYLIAGGISSALFIIGCVYLYRITGSLNIDIIAASDITSKSAFIALFFIVSSLLVDLKYFPANGWALDVYQSFPSGIIVMITTAKTAAIIFVLSKILPMITGQFEGLIISLGLLTFIVSNLIGIKQKNVKRMLGYSSIAQIGLIIAAYVIFKDIIGDSRIFYIVVGGLIVNHFIAKSGLFWLTGIVKEKYIRDWGSIAKNPLMIFMLAGFIFAILGFPPFLGFWSKWEMILHLVQSGKYVFVSMILLGSLFEAFYLLRWFAYSTKSREDVVSKIKINFEKILPVIIFTLILFAAAFFMLIRIYKFNNLMLFPVVVTLLMFAADWMNSKVKSIVTIGIIGIYAYFILPQLPGILLVFGAMFTLGGIVVLISTVNRSGSQKAVFPLLLMMVTSMTALMVTETTIEFFYLWELITVSTFCLILRGRKALKPSLLYLVFSLAAAFLLLVGFSFSFAQTGSIALTMLSEHASLVVFIFLVLGFLIKTGVFGIHIWLPSTYSESEDDISALISSVLSKLGLFGLVLTVFLYSKIQNTGGIDYTYIIGWLGIITAFFATVTAVFQEDIKRLLAFSSLGQIGYIVLAFAMNSHSGFVTALYLSINHLLFKGLLFLAFAGVIYRVKTRDMYKMGGLIKKMPFSFIAVLIAIIALSGVPPLSGFGGKWLLYTSLIERGWYLQAGFAFFASVIAFLYCYRLIHTAFLGQLKMKHQNLKRAPVILLIPQYILIMSIMMISFLPGLLLKPLIDIASEYYGNPLLSLQGHNVVNSLGYWNGYIVMLVTMAVFGIPFVWLLFSRRLPKKIKQLNIVYASERPDKPETTHFAYNFFSHYKRAFKYVIKPYVSGFWRSVFQAVESIGGFIRQIYTGNAQTYVIHIMIFIVILYFLAASL